MAQRQAPIFRLPESPRGAVAYLKKVSCRGKLRDRSDRILIAGHGRCATFAHGGMTLKAITDHEAFCINGFGQLAGNSKHSIVRPAGANTACRLRFKRSWGTG